SGDNRLAPRGKRGRPYSVKAGFTGFHFNYDVITPLRTSRDRFHLGNLQRRQPPCRFRIGLSERFAPLIKGADGSRRHSGARHLYHPTTIHLCAPLDACQNKTFRPNCTCRPTVWDPVSFPNALLPHWRAALVAAGSVNVGVLLRLKASARN